MLEHHVTVDVVIPTYAETERLFRAIESALAQDFPVHKVIVVDDGSSAEVRDRISSRYRTNNRVQLVFANHLGHPGQVRNIGIHQSTAEWIALLDADDYWEPDKLRRQLELAQKTNAELVYTDAFNVSEQSEIIEKRTSKLPEKINLRGLVLSNHLINSSVLVRRDVLKNAGNFVESPNVLGVEDYATWLRISLNCKLFGLDEPLVHYTVSETSLSRRRDGKTRLDALENFLEWLDTNRPHSSRKVGIGVFARLVIWQERLPGQLKRFVKFHAEK